MRDGRPSPYRRIRRQMLLVLLAFGLVPLVAMGVAGFVSSRAAIASRTRGVLEAMVKNRRATVELFLESTMRQLRLLADVLPVEQLSQPAVLERLLSETRHEPGGAFIDLGLIGEDGRHLAYAGPYRVAGLDYRDQPWFSEVLVNGRYESDIFLGLRRFPHMVMAVKKRAGGHDYILRATLDTDLLSALVREGGLESGADVFILNRSGEYQTRYSKDHRLMESADCWPVPLHSGVRVVERRHNRRAEFLATTWLRRDSWVLVARQRTGGVETHPAVVWVLAIGLIAIPALSWLVARHRLRQFRDLESERAGLFESVAQTQKMAAIGRLAAGVAHEINNPLAIIQAQVGVLADSLDDHPDFPGAEDFRARIAKVEAQVERGRKVTHRLLGFSRRVGPEVTPVDLAAALDETVSFVEKELESTQVRVERDYRPDAPIVRTDLSQVQQVFLNLINNALDAIGDCGVLRLSTRPAKGGAVVEISDNGAGIPEAHLARIFEPFYSTKAGGPAHSGLGLPICREIMRGLGGGIEVASQPGQGTTFTLFFPFEADESLRGL